MISIKITPVKTDFKNPEEKFINDFDSRFGDHAIIDDDSNIPYSVINRTCSKNQVRLWIDQWISENCDLSNTFKLKTNEFLKNQFKQVKKP